MGGLGYKGTWGCASPSRVSPGVPRWHTEGAGDQHPSSHPLKCGKGPRLLSPSPWHSAQGGNVCSCPPHPSCPPHCRRSCNSPMLPTSSSTPRSGHCYLTSSRHCSSSSHMTPSPLLRNSSPTSGPLGPPLPPLGLLAPSPTPQLATLQLTANKAASTACPVLFALGKLRVREGRWS